MSKSELLEIYLQKNVLQQDKRLFSCALCPYRTDRRNNLKRHTSTMHEQSSAVLECCGSRFANKAALRHHTVAFHRHGYVCNICGRVFCRRALLRRHHAVHSGFKEFTCQLCDYATSHKSNLERHMKIHDSSLLPIPISLVGGHSTTSNSRSPAELYHDADSSRPTPSPSPSREHNPILASLLSQPTQSGGVAGEVIQWVYSPYDSYMGHAIDPATEEAALTTRFDLPQYRQHSSQETMTMPKWGMDPEMRYWNPYSWEDVHQSNKRIVKEEASSLPLRHAIDVILGLREGPKPETPAEWPSSSLPSTPSRRNDLHSGGGLLQVDSNSDTHSNGSPIMLKREWRESEPSFSVWTQCLSPSTVLGPCSVSHDMSCASQVKEEPDVIHYVPKKLRMSKRYQSLL